MDVTPFAAVRYALSDPSELGPRVSLPYDQFGDEGREERYRRHPHNVVRLIKPRPLPGQPPEEPDRRARRTLDAWLEEGVLVRDPEPGIYPYRQVAEAPDGRQIDRWAVIARIRLTPFGEGPVLPHERTFAETAAERSRLREIGGADLGLILMVYDDPEGDADRCLRRLSVSAPVIGDAVDETGTRNVLQRSIGADAEAFCGALRGVTAIIADGHHRYTAALEHWRRRGSRADDAAGWIMAALVSGRAEGLTILPIHRTVGPPPPDGGVEGLVRSPFACRELGRGGTAAVAELSAAALRASHPGAAMVAVWRDGGELAATLITASADDLLAARWPPAVPTVWRRLDIAALHSLVLEPWLGEAASRQHDEAGVIETTNDTLEAVRSVAGGGRGAAFLLRPLSMQDVRRVVGAGEVLPPKSTNFYPKALSGLTIHRFAD